MDPNFPPMNEPDSGKGKKIAIGALILVLIASVGLYISDFSLKSLLFTSSQQEGEKVGTVKTVSGQLKRQPKDSLEFSEAKENADLFNEDTLMTGPNDHATIELFDGTILELDPGSLIRLTFEAADSVNGIERRVLVDIVAGNLKGNEIKPKVVVRRAGKPVARDSIPPSTLAPPAPARTETAPIPQPTETPMETPVAQPSPEVMPSPEASPEPTPSEAPPVANLNSLRLVQPKPGQTFGLNLGQLPPVKQAIIFNSPGAADAEAMIVLKNSAGKEVLRKTVKASGGRGGLLANFERPGDYQVQVLHPDGSPIGKGVQARFKVAGDFVGIETEAPLVGGEPIDSNQFTGKRLQEFDVVLRWKPVEGVGKYRVLVQGSAGKTLVDESVEGTQYAFPKGKIHSEPLTYTIRGDYKNGYVAVSKPQKFLFNFNSPKLTLPPDGDTVSLADPEVKRQQGILFSWQRTTFTTAYEFEIATDAGFQKVMKRVTVKQQDNFLLFRNLKPAEYWWRVRAIRGEMKSPVGAASKITVTP